MLYKNYSESNSENKMMSFANRSNYYIPLFPFTSTILFSELLVMKVLFLTLFEIFLQFHLK